MPNLCDEVLLELGKELEVEQVVGRERLLSHHGLHRLHVLTDGVASVLQNKLYTLLSTPLLRYYNIFGKSKYKFKRHEENSRTGYFFFCNFLTNRFLLGNVQGAPERKSMLVGRGGASFFAIDNLRQKDEIIFTDNHISHHLYPKLFKVAYKQLTLAFDIHVG